MDTRHVPGDIVRGRYRVVGTLGKGGAGTTYVAEDPELGRKVALKQLDIRGLGEWKRFELFEREARTLAGLVHPAIPRYLDSFQTDDGGPRLYIVQELAPGSTLAELVRAGFAPDEAEVRSIAKKLLRILMYLQSLVPPVVHRDLKPQNILRSDDGEISLVDFGSVKSALVDSVVGGSTVAGTFGYMAPEQLHGHATTATDLYGLGATLVFLLARRPPSELPQQKLKIDLRAHASVSPAFSGWLDKLLAPAPEDRFPTARDALFALDRGERAPPKVRWAGVAAFAAVALLVTTGGSLAVGRSLYAKRAPALREGSAMGARPGDAPLGSPSSAPSQALTVVRPTRVLAAHWSAVFSVAWSPDGKTLATGSNDGTLKLWNVATGQTTRSLPVAGGRVGALAFAHDGSVLAGSNDAALALWDPSTGAQVRKLEGATDKITSLAFAPDGKTLWSAGIDGTIHSWDRTTGEHKRALRHGKRAFAVAVSPNGQRLATGADDGMVRVWDTATGAELRALSHGGTIDAIALSPDGQTLVSTGDDHTIKVWLVERGVLVTTLEGHSDQVWCAKFQPDGRTFATGGRDGTVRLWDVYAGSVVRSFMADTKGVLSVTTSPDGKSIATGGGSGAVAVWPLEPGEEVERIDEDVAKKPGWTPLHVAAWDGDLAAVKSLLAKGTPVDVRNDKRRTPLYNAAKNDQLEVAAYLIEKGADVNATAWANMTPLWPSTERGHAKIVALLLAKGANVKIKNEMGQTFVYKAAEQGQAEVLKMLLEKGGTVNDVDLMYYSALTIACLRGHARVVESLLAQPSVDLGVTAGKLGETPLMLAARGGYDDIVRQLLAKGARVDTVDKGGYTALRFATEGKHTSTAALLLQHGAK